MFSFYQMLTHEYFIFDNLLTYTEKLLIKYFIRRDIIYLPN